MDMCHDIPDGVLPHLVPLDVPLVDRLQGGLLVPADEPHTHRQLRAAHAPCQQGQGRHLLGGGVGGHIEVPLPIPVPSVRSRRCRGRGPRAARRRQLPRRSPHPLPDQLAVARLPQRQGIGNRGGDRQGAGQVRYECLRPPAPDILTAIQEAAHCATSDLPVLLHSAVDAGYILEVHGLYTIVRARLRGFDGLPAPQVDVHPARHEHEELQRAGLPPRSVVREAHRGPPPRRRNLVGREEARQARPDGRCRELEGEGAQQAPHRAMRLLDPAR
mmetsp:Transcript_92878/g.267196  ORF Transcript_92878/g.267196 Transcript_92878/m.267196 type:complete len:273 (-) Transcript_92878:1477-2295(-)